MLLTEEEAKKKDCWQLSPDKNEQPPYCTASKCMAWRWIKESKFIDCNPTLKFKPQSEWKGYCGLANKP